MPVLHKAAEVTPLTPSTYHANLSTNYTVGTVPHGGYVTTVIQRAVALHFSLNHAKLTQPHLLALHLSFLRRTSVGGALITITDSKIGRQTSTVHVSLSQGQADGSTREEVVGYLTHTNLAAATGPSFDTPWRLQPPPAPRPKDWSAVGRGEDEHWKAQGTLPFSDFRKASQRVRWVLLRRPLGVGVQDQWIGLATRSHSSNTNSSTQYERWTDASLGFVVDMFPQLIETFTFPSIYSNSTSSPSAETTNARPKFWYPTVVLNMEVKKALPAEGVEWLFVRVLTKQVKNARYDLEAVVMDEDADLVALSHHVCFAVSASRNLKERIKVTGRAKDKGKL